MWEAVEIDSSDEHLKFIIREENKPVSVGTFLKYLRDSKPFREFYKCVLADSGFEAFFWENKPFTANTLSDPYECNLVQSTYLANQSSDKKTFRKYFDDNKEIAYFSNLGNDAQLIVPVPKSQTDDFTHIGRFLREAGKNQIDLFWKTVADETLKRISDNPVWLSTSGIGVYWLHVRIDTYPKYYQTEDFKTL